MGRTIWGKARRAGRSHAAPQHIGADDKIAIGINRLARADHLQPPSRLARARMARRDMLIHCQRVTDQNRVAAIVVERAIGFIGDIDRGQHRARIERERPGQRDCAAKAKTRIVRHRHRG